MLRFLQAALAATLALVPASGALATGIVPISGVQQFDKDASPPAYLVGGQLYVYQPTTTTCAAVYQDFALTVPFSCPIVLPSSGRIPPIYGADGSVRLRLLNASNVQQFDDDNVALVTAAASGGGTTPIPDSTQIYGTRDLKVRFDDQPISGYVRLNGRTIGSGISGATERANSDTQSLFLALWPYANIAVSGGKGASAAADWAANKQLVLPDFRGRLLGANSDMGAGACSSNCITSATVGSPTVVGATGGTETVTIAQGNLPNYNLPHTLGWAQDTGTGTSNRQGVTSTGGINVDGGSTVNVVKSSELQTQTITTTTTGHITGTVPSGGSGTALTNTPPVMLLTFYLKL